MKYCHVASESLGKFLVVLINDKFKVHINPLYSKVLKLIGILYRSRNILPKSSRVSIYYTLVNPYLTYCNLVWESTYDCYLDPLI